MSALSIWVQLLVWWQMYIFFYWFPIKPTCAPDSNNKLVFAIMFSSIYGELTFMFGKYLRVKLALQASEQIIPNIEYWVSFSIYLPIYCYQWLLANFRKRWQNGKINIYMLSRSLLFQNIIHWIWMFLNEIGFNLGKNNQPFPWVKSSLNTV